MTTQKAMPHRAGALGLPSKRIEAVPGGVESLAFDISTRQLTRMPTEDRFAVPVTLE